MGGGGGKIHWRGRVAYRLWTCFIIFYLIDKTMRIKPNNAKIMAQLQQKMG